MALSISVRSTDSETKALAFDLPRVVIGRSAGCDVCLPDPSVSQRHASIRQRGGDFIVLDENSTNGTFVGPVRLPPGTPRVLQRGDLIRVGRVWLEVNIDHEANPSSAADTKELALRLVAGALRAEGAPSAPLVHVVRGPDPNAGPLILEDFGHAYTVGRSPQCDLVIDDDDLSRRHIELKRVGGDVLVKDLGSKNGSAIGEVRVERERKWNGREPLVLGRTELSLEDPLAETLSELEASPDEVVDESLEPPTTGPKTDETDDDAVPASAPTNHRDKAAGGKAAPIAARPKRSSARHKERARSSWTGVDLLVAALAIVVLTLSVAGIAWLVRG